MPVVDIRLLNQNIGYVHVSPLVSTDQMVAAVAGSINQLRRAKAVIFDVRDVPGGDPGMVTRLCGYVVSEPKLLLINQVRGGNQQPRWTVSDPAGPRLGDVPVAVVMNGRTASAGEALAFGLRGIGRATLIGERTRGAGNSGSIVPLPAGFSLWLPTGRSFDPRTGQGWEGTGVLPDIVVSGDAALSEAIKFLSSSRPRA
ncbi:MAG: S41 family peptidase [Sphingosinicella sp.]|nr:S41 family peptidase [Sphingosinicella sp.]